MAMSNYVKYPLVLGTVCLACGVALAGVNFATEPVIDAQIEAAKIAALYTILDDNSLEVKNGADITDLAWDGDHAETLEVRKLVPCEDDDYYYYQATSEYGYSGTVTFGALVDTDFAVVGFEYIAATEDASIGIPYVKDITISLENPYTGGSLVSGETVEAGASAKFTQPVIELALQDIIADAETI